MDGGERDEGPIPDGGARPRGSDLAFAGAVPVAPTCLVGDDRLRQALHGYFAWATTTTMSRFHRSADDVPDGLQIPHWSWDGLVSGTGPDDL